MFNTPKALSLLLMYPEIEVISALGEIKDVIKDEKLLSAGILTKLDGFFDYLTNDQHDIYLLQSEYTKTFDRGRKNSLHLFEHIHGDSRFRGQAMIDLVENYHAKGLDMNSNELPDYLPLFLEYISLLDKSAMDEELGETVDILMMLKTSLEKIESPYAVIFDSILDLTSVKPNLERLEKAISLNEEDYDMDKEWEEPQVFGSETDCQTCPASDVSSSMKALNSMQADNECGSANPSSSL